MNGEITFHLEDFDGPLELLLALVSKHKMDLHNIPILTLIDQYTQTVDAARQAGPEVASAFIEMAARLVEMKELSAAAPQRRRRADEGGIDRSAGGIRPVPASG